MLGQFLGACAQVVSVFPKYRFANPHEIINRLTRIAVPVLTIAGVSIAQQANAGPVAYMACMNTCIAATLGGFAPLCIAGCIPFLTAPTP